MLERIPQQAAFDTFWRELVAKLLQILHIQQGSQGDLRPHIIALTALRDKETALSQPVEELTIIKTIRLLEEISPPVRIQKEKIDIGRVFRTHEIRLDGSVRESQGMRAAG